MKQYLSNEKEYKEWLGGLSKSYRLSQIKAAVSVNREMLNFYWLLGRDILRMRGDSQWGEDFFNKLSRDMREMIPDSRSFSVTNLRYMTRFYELFPADVQMSPQIGAEMQGSVLPEILPQVGAELFGVPWGHVKPHTNEFACFLKPPRRVVPL